MNYKVGVDLGRTFTDFLLMNEEGVTRNQEIINLFTSISVFRTH